VRDPRTVDECCGAEDRREGKRERHEEKRKCKEQEIQRTP
jgi:hypothetical protein